MISMLPKPLFKKVIIPISIPLVLIVLGVGVYFYSQGFLSPSSSKGFASKLTLPALTPSATTSSQTKGGKVETKEEPKNIFTIDAKGINPKFYTIKKEDKVSWVNNDTKLHEIASDPHPTHLDYAPFNTIGKLDPKQSKTLNFAVPGTYRFHDHLNPSFKGSVTVR